VVVKEIRNVGVVEMDYGKAKSVKDIMSEMLAEWLCKDFGILIDEPSEKEIAETLEEHKKEVLDDGVNKR
jgi:hypothetical protein